VRAALRQGHLLLLAEAFADHLIHRRLHNARADAFAMPVALAVAGVPGATAGKFTVRHKSMLYHIVRDTVDQHQSSVKHHSVLLCSAQLMRVQIAEYIVFPPLMATVLSRESIQPMTNYRPALCTGTPANAGAATVARAVAQAT
jgi:hypothetical protein